MTCQQCKKSFVSEKGTRYCQKTCRLRAARIRSYAQIRKFPERLVRYRACARTYQRRIRKWLADYKLARGCMDCGYKDHSAALQLDHTGKKAVEISIARSSVKRLQREIKAGKCVVRCANCHSIRTWQAKQGAT